MGIRDNRIAVRFQYEWHDAETQWYRSYGNELWEFDDDGLMRRREASINDLKIQTHERRFLWPAPGDRPQAHVGSPTFNKARLSKCSERRYQSKQSQTKDLKMRHLFNSSISYLIVISIFAPLFVSVKLSAQTAAGVSTNDDSIVHHRTQKVEGLDIFYREAGPKSAPTIVLLHGFPTQLADVPQSCTQVGR